MSGKHSRRAVVVHSAAHARLALRVASELGVPVMLTSPAGFATYAGAAYFSRMIEVAREGLGDADHVAILDCGDAVGYALSAFRAGVKHVSVNVSAERRARLEGIAVEYGATIVRPVRRALDLAGSKDPEMACREWLAPDSASQGVPSRGR